jgi:histidine triad (HIT) family protein
MSLLKQLFKQPKDKIRIMELSEEQKQQLVEQKKHCPFCRIVSGEIPSNKVYEDNNVLAILDINPAKKGHVLLLPKEHHPIMALLPKEESEHLYTLLPELTKYLREALLAKHTTTFIANGAAAGQQTGHFMIHIIPSDKPLNEMNPARKQQPEQAFAELQRVLSHNVPLMMQKNAKQFPKQAPLENNKKNTSQQLAELLEEQPAFKKLLIQNPEAVLAGLEDNPSLKPLFEGIDVHVLSKTLKEQEENNETQEQPVNTYPRAIDLSNEELQAYLEENKKIIHYLAHDLETLKEAINQQPKLKHFFSETTPEEVLSRVQTKTASLEDALGGTK